MFKIVSIAIGVVVVVLLMSGIVTVNWHPDKVSGVTNFVVSLIGNKDRIAAGQKVLDNLKNKGTQLLTKKSQPTPVVSASSTPSVAGVKDTKLAPTKKPSIDIKTTIPLSF